MPILIGRPRAIPAFDYSAEAQRRGEAFDGLSGGTQAKQEFQSTRLC
jgi:hypothetical protein